MWMHNNCAGAGLWAIFRRHPYQKMDNCDIGTPALVQLNTENQHQAETPTEPPKQFHHYESTDDIRHFHIQWT
jgi:hypothetical protein